ncbi:MAG: cobalt ABC transporter ATP-binding protein [Candidatus Solibacter sp.]|nr:cobalt ABC transporter ATP-binding protein [Candidatus Solibacter sp.]
MGLTLLDADAVRFRYGPGPWTVDGVDLQLAPGARVALLGANGAGKTTLLHLLMGLHQPCAGTILRKVPAGLVLQNPDDQLFAETVEADVALGPFNQGLTHADSAAAARRAIEEMDIAHLSGRRVATLSLGEKKRVALAGVLALRPRVLLLDEPTSGLDHPGAEALLAALARLSDAGVALVIATHNTGLALEWASHSIVLAEGRVLAAGPPRDLLQCEDLCRAAGLRVPLLARIHSLLQELHPEDAPRDAITRIEDLRARLSRLAAPKEEIVP